MAPLKEQLLPLGGSELQGRHWGRASWAAAVPLVLLLGLSVAACLLLGGAEFGRTTPHTHVASPLSLKVLNQSLPIDGLELESTSACYKYTGGTCMVEACLGYRKAECINGQCLCPTGCTGADGSCHHEQSYKLVGSGFTLTNQEYDWQKMYMPSTAPLDQLKTTAFSSLFNGGKDKFFLHKLPGKLMGHRDYFLSTQAFPDYTAAIRPTAGTAFSLFGAYELGLNKALPWGPEDLSVRVCSKGSGMLMIGSPGETKTAWFYIHHGSWNVYGWTLGDPGASGVWISDPPVHDVPKC